MLNRREIREICARGEAAEKATKQSGSVVVIYCFLMVTTDSPLLQWMLSQNLAHRVTGTIDTHKRWMLHFQSSSRNYDKQLAYATAVQQYLSPKMGIIEIEERRPV